LHSFRKTDPDDFTWMTCEAVARREAGQVYTKAGCGNWGPPTAITGLLPGTLRYEACGISNQEKALEVDHIMPRNKGGGNDPKNL